MAYHEMTGKSSNIIQMTGRGSVTLLLSQEESKFFFWAEGRKQVGQLLSNIIHLIFLTWCGHAVSF